MLGFIFCFGSFFRGYEVGFMRGFGLEVRFVVKGVLILIVGKVRKCFLRSFRNYTKSNFLVRE